VQPQSATVANADTNPGAQKPFKVSME